MTLKRSKEQGRDEQEFLKSFLKSQNVSEKLKPEGNWELPNPAYKRTGFASCCPPVSVQRIWTENSVFAHLPSLHTDLVLTRQTQQWWEASDLLSLHTSPLKKTPPWKQGQQRAPLIAPHKPNWGLCMNELGNSLLNQPHNTALPVTHWPLLRTITAGFLSLHHRLNH